MFDNMSDGTKGLVRSFYINGIALVFSSVGDPMILFVLILYALNVGGVLILLYFTFGDAIENFWYFLKEKFKIRRQL